MPTRRDLLKYFGVGSVIAPVVAGAANLSTQARIIEPPRVELIKPDVGLVRLPMPIPMSDVSTVEMTITLRDGTVRRATVNPYRAKGVFPSFGAMLSFIASQEVRGSSPMYSRSMGELHCEAVLWP